MKWTIARLWWELIPRPIDYVPSILTAELRECDTFQFLIWDTGYGGMDILFVKVNTRNAYRARARRL